LTQRSTPMIVKRIAQIVWTDLRWSKAIAGTPIGQGNKNGFIVPSITLRQVGINVNLDDTIRLRSLSNSRLSRSPYLPLSTIVFRFFVAKPLGESPNRRTASRLERYQKESPWKPRTSPGPGSQGDGRKGGGFFVLSCFIGTVTDKLKCACYRGHTITKTKGLARLANPLK
jgi:hypothetical protein